MTNEKMNELDIWLGKYPMNRRLVITDGEPGKLEWIDKKSRTHICWHGDWQPTRNITQAIECADKFPFWAVEKQLTLYMGSVWTNGKKWQISEKVESPSLGLSLACQKAWEE